MNTIREIKWLLSNLFKFKKTLPERLEWHWYWTVEIPDRFRFITDFLLSIRNFIFSFLGLNKNKPNDEIPF